MKTPPLPRLEPAAVLRAVLVLSWLALAAAAALSLSALAASAAPAPALRALAERGAWKKLRAELAASPKADAAEIAYLQSRVRQGFGDAPGALAQAETAVKLDPKNVDYRVQLAELVGQSAQKAGPLKMLSLGKRFKKEIEAAIALDPKHVDARLDLMMFHLQAPGIAGGDEKKGLAEIEAIARIDPVRGHLARMSWSLAKKDTARAEAALRQALAQAPGNFDVQARAAGFFANRLAYDAAETHARRAIAIDPARIGPHSVLAALRAKQGRWDDVDAVLAAAEAAAPGNLGAHYQAARILVADKREGARAERWLRRYLEVEPEGFAPAWPAARWRLGQALELQGKTAEAIKELEAAVAQKPDLDDAKKDLKRLRQGKSVARKE